MFNLIRAEFYKLRSNRIFWMLFVFMTLWGVVQAILISLAAKGVLYLNINEGFMMGEAGSGPRYSESGLATFMNTLEAASNPFFLSLLLGIFAGFFISDEYKTGVIKNTMICGRRRSEIYIAKCIVYFFGVISLWIIFPLIAACSATAAIGFSHVTDSITLLSMMRTVGLALLLLVSYSVILVSIGVMVEESGKAIMLSMSIISGVVLFFLILGSSISSIRTLYEYTIFSQMKAAFGPSLTSMEMGRCLLVGLITPIVVSFVGMGVFRRKEIK